MNKKFSTLMATGLLVLGALFSNVNAQTTAKSLDLTNPISYEAADLNQYYYIGLGDKSAYLTLDEVTNTDVTPSSTVIGKKFNSLKGVLAAGLAAEGDKALFKIEVVKVSTASYFKLTNKSNGKSIQFNATASPTAGSTAVIAAGDNAAAVGSYFDLNSVVNFNGGTGAKIIPFHGGATANTNELKLDGATFSIESTGDGVALVLYIADDTNVANSELNDMFGNGFSLKFKEMTPAINANPFTASERIQAVTVTAGTTSVPAGTYLKVAGADFDAVNMGTKADVAKFTAATFIVMDTIPLTKDGSSNFNGKQGAGYQFTTVKGADLLTIDAITGLPTETYNKRHVNNANFAITNNVNNTDSLIVEVVTPVLGVNDQTMDDQTAYGSNVRVSVINFGGQNILTTYSVTDGIVPADDEWTLITLGGDNIVDLKTLLKGQFVNVSYVATGKEADVDKYKVGGVLAVRDNAGTVEPDYVAKSTVLLSSPEAQWALTNDGGLKLVNRENTTEFLTITQLRKTAKAGVYTASAAGSNIDGDQITISFVENHTMFDGYMTATENILRNTVYYLGQYRATADGDLNSYWAENHNASHQIGATVVKDNATKWNLELVKKADKNEVDTIFVVSTMNVWANNKMTTKKDSLAILPYAYQNNGNNEYVTYNADKLNYYICDKDNQTNAKAAERFALKMKPGNTFNYVIAEDGGVQNNVGAEKVFLSNSESKGSWDKNELYSLNNNSLMVVEKADEPEYRKVAKSWGDTISIYRQENDAQKLYEKLDAKSVLANDTLSFLNIDNDYQFKMNPAIFADTAYINRGTGVDANTCYQYLLVVEPSFGYHTEGCDVPGHPQTIGAIDTVYGRFLVNLIDTANVYGKTHLHNNPYINKIEADENLSKLSFVDGYHTGDKLYIPRHNNTDTLVLDMNSPAFNVAKFAFRYVDNEAGTFKIQTQWKEYAPSKEAKDILASQEGYLRWVNGTVVVTNGYTKGDVFNMNENVKLDPVANENTPEVSSISVNATNGAVIINGAAGKKVVITNVLGQTIANTVVTSDNATISAPAGVVVVAVEGEAAVKAIVK